MSGVKFQEPDLYTAHKERPNIANYTTAIYMDVCTPYPSLMPATDLNLPIGISYGVESFKKYLGWQYLE